MNEAKGSLLDDEQLVNALQTSKTTSQEVSEQLTIAEQTEIKIDTAREGITWLRGYPITHICVFCLVSKLLYHQAN